MSKAKYNYMKREYYGALSDAIREEDLGHYHAAQELSDYADHIRMEVLFYMGIDLGEDW